MDQTGTENGFRRAIEAAAGGAVRRMAAVRGGDVAASYCVDLDDGRRLFAKTHHDPPPGFFTTEALGLEWLREAAAVLVPGVVAVSDGTADEPAFLALEWIDEGPPQRTKDSDLGRALALLHKAGAPCFGRTDGRTTGSRRLPNDPRSTWADFYADDRLVPLARLARDGNALDRSTVEALERLATRLDDFDTGEPPARLHGDLWAGNRLVDTHSRSWLIDPASHGGHREFDLAMMRLFGGFSPATFAAYEEAYPLADGWTDRVTLHQIAPLVVHAVKFGGGYVAAATAAILRY